MAKYYIRMKTLSNELVLGYRFGETKNSLERVVLYGKRFKYKSDLDSVEEWKLRQEIFEYAVNEFDWTTGNAKLKKWIVCKLKQFAKIHGFKVEVSESK